MKLFRRPRNPKHIWDFPVPEGWRAVDGDHGYTFIRHGLNVMYEVRQSGQIRVWYNLPVLVKVEVEEMLKALGIEYPERKTECWMYARRKMPRWYNR